MSYVKFVTAIVCIFVFFHTTEAQVHMKGVNHLEISSGFFDSFDEPGYHVGIYYAKIRNKHWWWRIGFQGNTQELSSNGFAVPVRKYLVNGSYFYTLGSLFRNRLYFNVGGGALIGYEQINNGEARINESVVLRDRSKTVFGLNPEANVELFLSSKCILSLNYSKRVLINSDLSIWDDVYSAGVKFYIH